MGQKNTKPKELENISAEIAQQSISSLFVADSVQLTESSISSINVINRKISSEGISEKRQQGFYFNQTLLKCFYSPKFQEIILKTIELLSKELKSLLEAKLIAFVPREKFRTCLSIANFILLFTDESLIQTINLLQIRSDLFPDTKKLIVQLCKEGVEVNQSLLGTLSIETLGELCKCLRLSLSLMIDLHLKLFTRSDFTLSLSDELSKSLFMLYCKIYFLSKKEVGNQEKQANIKIIQKIGAYFLGLGYQKKTPSVFQAAVLLLSSVCESNINRLQQLKALPSHLFKSLPIITNNHMGHWLFCNLLFSLKYHHEGEKVYSKLNINRIPSLKLLKLIVSKCNLQSEQSTFLLEELCLQTRVFQIERVYVSAIAQQFCKQKQTNAIKTDSEILRRACQGNEVTFNVKSLNREVRVRPEDVMTELQNDEQTYSKEICSVLCKYTLQVIFSNNQILYDYSDKALWGVILCQMENDGNLSDSHSKPVEMKEMHEEIQ